MVIQVLSALLGGGFFAGVTVSLINLIYHRRSARRQRRADFLLDQLHHLYGPVYFFTSQNESIFSLNDKFVEAYRKHYEEPDCGGDEHAHKVRNEEISQTVGIANAYINRIEENNNKIVEVLEKNFSLIDPEDVEVFARFIVNYTRRKTEWDEHHLKTPPQIYREIGNVSIMGPEFVERVRDKFLAKRKELDKLSRVNRRLSRLRHRTNK
jgi:hypothetical protein